MEQERTPKERRIFDDSVYYGTDGEQFAIEELMSSFDLTEQEVREGFSEDEIFDRAMQMKQFDFEEELSSLSAYFDGEESFRSGEGSKNAGNPIIVSGSIGRWDGTHSGFTVFNDFDDVMQGADSPFKDCEIKKIWDENGHMFIRGAHHDGSVTVELRQLTAAGAQAYEEISEAWVGEPFTITGNSSTSWAFKTYDGSDRSVIEALRDLWSEPSFTPTPCYAERAFGCPASEWEEDETPEQGMDLKGVSQQSRDASAALSGQVVCKGPSRTEQEI